MMIAHHSKDTADALILQADRRRAVYLSRASFAVKLLLLLGCIETINAPRAWASGAGPIADASEEILSYRFLELDDPHAVRDANGLALLTFAGFDANDVLAQTQGFESLDAWLAAAPEDPSLAAHRTEQAGWQLAGGNEDVFWQLRALVFLCPEYENILTAVESRPLVLDGNAHTYVTPGIEVAPGLNYLDQFEVMVHWNPAISSVYGRARLWDNFPPLVALAHEIAHAYQRIAEDRRTYSSVLQPPAIKVENLIRYAFYRKVPDWRDLRPRPGNRGFYLGNDFEYLFDDVPWLDWPAERTPLLDVREQE
jgi:hypothetical protein